MRARESHRGFEFLVLAIVLEVLVATVVASVRRTLFWTGVALAAAVLVVAGTLVSAAARPR